MASPPFLPQVPEHPGDPFFSPAADTEANEAGQHFLGPPRPLRLSENNTRARVIVEQIDVPL